MAIRPARLLHPARTIATVLALGVTALCVSSPASAAPRSAPSTESLQKQLGQLALKNTQLVEQVDAAQVQLTKAQSAVRVAEATARVTAAGYETARVQFVSIVQAQYEGSNLGAAGALLQSRSNSDYVDRVNSLSLVAEHVAQVISRVDSVRRTSETDALRARTLLATATTRSEALAAKRKTVTAQIAKYRTMLATLSSAQQSAFQRSQNPAVKLSSFKLGSAGTPAARKAVQFALDQVGKPYVFGAAGPSSWDCSGLTMAAWQAGGVSLPHSAANQYNYGKHVGRDDLEPGDLLFFYTPIAHVTIYAGDGLMVSAPTEGQDVSVVPVAAFANDYVGATRLT